MREILFRAKAINRDVGSHRTSYKNGDWVYGLITRLYDERFKILPAEMRDIDGVNGIEIDYTTIGQYTGLTDKDNKRIFEGDIIKNTWTGDVHTVDWCVDCAVWVLPCVTDERQETTFNSYSGDDYMIIGNIHDNPELLKGGAE